MLGWHFLIRMVCLRRNVLRSAFSTSRFGMRPVTTRQYIVVFEVCIKDGPGLQGAGSAADRKHSVIGSISTFAVNGWHSHHYGDLRAFIEHHAVVVASRVVASTMPQTEIVTRRVVCMDFRSTPHFYHIIIADLFSVSPATTRGALLRQKFKV